MTTYFCVLLIFLAYLFGSLSSAVIVCKLMGLPDPRSAGSNNPGATNVLRIGGKKAAALTLLGDVLKGVIPVLIARLMHCNLDMIGLVTFAAFFGHLYPIFFKFQGGKGIATLIGCLLAFNVYAGCLFLITWLLVAIIFRYSSLASLTATMLAPFYIWVMTHDSFVTDVFFIIAIFIFIRHRKNIDRLLEGSESKIRMRK